MTMKRIVLTGALCAAGLATMAGAAWPQGALPATLAKAGQLNVGVKCDAPPYGYLDGTGGNVGIDVEFARHIAKVAFKDETKVKFTCVTSATRIQMLRSDKVDLLIATLGVTEDRKKAVDFTESTNWAGSSVLVRADGASSGVTRLDELNGKTIVTLTGGWAVPYFEKNYPKINLIKLESLNDAIQTVRQGRADAVAQDIEPLVAAAEKDPQLKLTNIVFLVGWAAPAVRRGDNDLRLFVNEVIQASRRDGTFERLVKRFSEGKLQELILEGYLKPAPDGSSAQNPVLP